jgi:hypothetical protein
VSLSPRAVGKTQAVLVDAEVEVANERIDLRSLHVWIGRKIGRRVEPH